MAKIDDVQRELAGLITEGARLLEVGQQEKLDLATLALDYETWYTKALAAVTQLIPERRTEFVEAYRRDKRRDLSAENYTISDYLGGLSVSFGGRPSFNTKAAFAAKILRQVAIVKAAADAAPSLLRDIRAVLLTELLDSDLDSSRELAKSGHLRAAGTMCGVALEAHLATVCQRRGLKVGKKNPTIADFNDLLKESRAYDVPTWRLIQRLSDIRNVCAHARDRDPTKEEVADLIAGTAKVIKEVF